MALDQTMVEEIAKSIKLCRFKKRLWFPTRQHRSETATLNAKHGTRSGRVLVTPCDHPLLVELKKVHDKAYALVTDPQNSQRSMLDGVYQVRVCREQILMEEMPKFEAEHNRIVPEFTAIYPALFDDAPRKNNGLHDPAMWVPKDQIASYFEWFFKFMPVPTDPGWNWFVESNAVAAHEHLTGLLMKALTRVADRCSSSGKLFQTVFSNLAELLELVPDFNIIKDAKLAQLADECKIIASQSKEELTKDPGKKKDVAAAAKRLVGIFGANLKSSPPDTSTEAPAQEEAADEPVQEDDPLPPIVEEQPELSPVEAMMAELCA